MRDTEMRRVAVVQDFARVAPDSADWSRLDDLARVDFITEPLGDAQEASQALRGYDIVCSMRERLPLTRDLIERLPDLRLFVATSEANRFIDYEAADELGVELAGTPSGGLSSSATAELTWGLRGEWGTSRTRRAASPQ